jgi:hypothetical protein
MRIIRDIQIEHIIMRLKQLNHLDNQIKHQISMSKQFQLTSNFNLNMKIAGL